MCKANRSFLPPVVLGHGVGHSLGSNQHMRSSALLCCFSVADLKCNLWKRIKASFFLYGSSRIVFTAGKSWHLVTLHLCTRRRRGEEEVEQGNKLSKSPLRNSLPPAKLHLLKVLHSTTNWGQVFKYMCLWGTSLITTTTSKES